MIPVLLYHDIVADSGGDRWTVSRDALAAQLDLVLDSGRRPVTASYLAARLLGEPTSPDTDPPGLDHESPAGSAGADHEGSAGLCAVTFDDGFASFVELALPLLRERNIPATLYVTTGLLDGPAMLSSAVIGQLAGQERIELGAHAVHHRHLDLLPIEQAESEIVGSQDRMAELTGEAPRSFAYPHGSFTRAVRDLVRDAGFHHGYAVKNAFTHPADDRYALARLTVEQTTDLARTRDWLAGTGAPRSWRRERLRTTVYRQVRRRRIH